MSVNETTLRNADIQQTWQHRLTEWLKTNPKTIPRDLKELRAEFVRKFPKENIGSMTLEDYAQGLESKDSFCTWLEFKTKRLGGIGGGSAYKWGVFWSRRDAAWRFTSTYEDENDAISRIRDGLSKLVKAAEDGRYDDLDHIGTETLGASLGLRCKPLYLYFPDYLLPISQPDHLRQFLTAFGVKPEGDVLALNRQLLSFLRNKPEFYGIDSSQMAEFLYHGLKILKPPVEGQRIWKIAPGPQAKYWDQCRENKCIAISFLNDVDFRSFKDRDAIKQALVESGQKAGNDLAIWRFAHRMKPGDIVVANQGVSGIVGIGIIESDYIAPTDPNNPSEIPDYRHARRVDWLITEPLGFQGKIFIQQTVGRVEEADWQTIKQDYLTKFPALRAAFQKLDGKQTKDDVPAEAPLQELEELISLTARTRNIILYGPPGTGKTFLVSEFAKNFIRPQLDASASAEESRSRVLESLKWYEAIALAMSMDAKASFKVPELMQTETLKGFADLKKAEKVSSVVWAQLGSHTSPESKTVHYPTKHEPFLFDKDEQSRWSLTTAGIEFVQENLTESLSQLKNPATIVTEASDFSEFVTFHQSFSYEEFIEGLKPFVNDDGELTYEVRPGVFKQIAARAEVAWKNHGESAPNYLLIIDEINRANIAKVFGELITLIEDDKRLGQRNALELRLPYSGDKFGVPPNLYIVGTMNTADRSIALLDLALRRRFSFIEVTPNPSHLKTVAGIDLAELLRKLNEKIELLLDRDHRIGHSYFMKVKDSSNLHFAWYRRVLPLLQEYFYNDGERLYALLGDGFMKRIEIGTISTELSELVDTDSPRYEIKVMTEEELLPALAGYA